MAEKDQELLNFNENLKSTRKLVASGNFRHRRYWHKNGHTISLDLLPAFHILRKFSDVRQRYGRKPGDKMDDLDVNTILWPMFMSVTLQAAVHLGKDSENLHSIKNQPKRTLKQLFQEIGKLIRDQKEISGIIVIN